MVVRPVRRAALAAVVFVAALSACAAGPPTPPASTAALSASGRPPVAAQPPAGPAPSARAGDAGESLAVSNCSSVLPSAAVQGLLGGPVRVSGGTPRVTGGVTSTRCDWRATNDRYLTVIALSGPRLATRSLVVSAGSTPVAGRPGVRYHPDRGLIVAVSDRLYQVVAGGAGTAQARVVGLKAVDRIRAAAG